MNIDVDGMADEIIKEPKVQMDIKLVSSISALAEILIQNGIITEAEFEKKYKEFIQKFETQQKEMIKEGIKDEINKYKAGGQD